jgi:DNA-binding transcriptional regulator YiaG
MLSTVKVSQCRGRRTLGKIYWEFTKDADVTTVQQWTGREARALREAMRMSVRDFANHLGISTRAVSKWEAGAEGMIPRPDSQSILDTVLEKSPPNVRVRFEQLLDARRNRANELEASADSSYNLTHARESLPGNRFRTAAELLPLPNGQGAAEDVFNILGRIQRLHRGTVHPEVIRQLQENARRVVTEYESQNHSTLVTVLLKQRALIEDILDECRNPAQQQEIFKIAGVTSGVLGYIAVGRGEFPLARAYCLEAFHLGDFARDSNLEAWARGLQSFCEYYAGEYDDAVGLAKDGLKYAQSGPQSARLTINGVARAMGKLGDTEGVHRAVDEAHELMSRNDVPAGVPSSISLECYSAAQTASNAATAYVSLGIPGKVEHYVNLALPDIGKSDSPWSRSLVMIDLAVSKVRAREPDLDHAADLVRDALTISTGRPIISVQQRTSDFVAEVISRWGKVPQVRAIQDAASTLGLNKRQHG